MELRDPSSSRRRFMSEIASFVCLPLVKSEMIEPDCELVRRSLRGEQCAFEELVRRHGRRVRAIAFARTLDDSLAEDVAQEAFLKAYRQLATLRKPDSFGSWVCQIAGNTAKNLMRQRRREIPSGIEFLADTPNPYIDQELFEDEEEMRGLAMAGLRALPDSLRVPLVLSVMEGKNPEDVAQALGISPSALAKRLSRAKERLDRFFARSGNRERAVAALRTRVLALPAGWEIIRSVMERLPAHVPHAPLQPNADARYGVGISLGLHLSLALLGATVFQQPAQEVAPSPEGTRTMRVVVLGEVNREMAKGSPVTTKEPRTREIVSPGQEHVGWVPLAPWSNPSSVEFQSRSFASVPGGGVARNDHFVGKLFDPVSGTVTLELWLKPAEGRANTGVGLLIDHDPEPMQLGLVHRTDNGVWVYNRSDVFVPIPRTPAHDAVRLQIVYRTEVAAYDLTVDDVRVGEWISAGAADAQIHVNRPVAGVYLGGGWNRVGMPVYFDDMRVSVQPTAGLRTVVREPRPKQMEDSLRLVSGFVNGLPLAEDRTLYARPSETVEGWLDVDVGNSSGPNADFYVVTVPGWGDRTRNYASVEKMLPGVHRVRVPVRFGAPEHEGTYYWWTVAGPQTDAKYLASVTTWGCGKAVWDDGNDVSDWGDSEFSEVQEQGRVRSIWLEEAGRSAPGDIVACALRVVVRK